MKQVYLPPKFDQLSVEQLQKIVKGIYSVMFPYNFNNTQVTSKHPEYTLNEIAAVLRDYSAGPRAVYKTAAVAGLTDVLPDRPPTAELKELVSPFTVITKADFSTAMLKLDPWFNELNSRYTIEGTVFDGCDFIDLDQ